MKNNKNFIIKANNIVSETHRSDGTLATRLVKDNDKYLLFQYDKNGQVAFCQEIRTYSFNPADITYNDGCVASITRRDSWGKRTITQYDEKGHVTSSIELNSNDIVNFSPSGYVRSVVKNISAYGFINESPKEIEEITFNDFGYIVSSTHKVKITRYTVPGQEKWMTTEAKQYYPNGNIASHITYKQKTKSSGSFISENQEDEAASYISSIMQYHENGKVQISAQLGEYDEISFNGEKVACITRRMMKNGNLETVSQTTYYPSGNLCTITNYQNGKVVSSVTYDETGKPQSSAQQGSEGYQDIYKDKKKSDRHYQKAMPFTKTVMTTQQAAGILGMSLNVSEKELAKAYHNLCKIWHPDRNPGKEDLAKRKMQEINEAYAVMLKYVKSRSQQRPNIQNPERPQNRSATFEAWLNLQEAIRTYDKAVEILKQVTAEKRRIEIKYMMTPANDPNKAKLAQQLEQIKITWSRCVNDKIKAQMRKYACEREYNRIRMQQNAYYQQKNYCYQRAA